MPDDERAGGHDGAIAVVRRAPFSANPHVGARGQRTQQRILDGAVVAFSEEGYHGASIDRIATLARCSRVSFYQYFASKEDVFVQLAGQVARQVSASTEALDPITSDAAGWVALRAWISRYTEIHARYAPVFHSLERDDVLASIAGQIGRETVTRIHARVINAALPPRRLDPVIRLLLEMVNHALDVVGVLGASAADAYPDVRVEVALTDVVHRSLFGGALDVNVHAAEGAPAPRIPFGSEMLELLRPDAPVGPDGRDSSGKPALVALLASARDVFVERGYHDTRVEDLVTAAGVSHGAFYRYFDNKETLARLLTADAVRVVGGAVGEIPEVSNLEGSGGHSIVRSWLRRYHAAHASEAAMLRVWVDAAQQDPVIRAESAPLLDWGRRRMSRYLAPRKFGDTDMDAVVMVALLGVFGARARTPGEVDAAAHIIECGLLGR